jgi:outer membrane lipoprotein
MDEMQMMAKNVLLSGLLAVGTLLFSACTSVPTQLQGEYADISPARVQPELFGSKVRWGGVLVDTRNEQERTCFEVLSRTLDRYLRPRLEDSTAGRFIACTNGFHDPEVFAKGREVTITGQIQNVEVRKIEEFDYRYPVVEIIDMVLWEERQDVIIYDNYYDPFYYPYYWGHPYWGYYPYYRYPGPYHGPHRMDTRKTMPAESATIKRGQQP